MERRSYGGIRVFQVVMVVVEREKGALEVAEDWKNIQSLDSWVEAWQLQHGGGSGVVGGGSYTARRKWITYLGWMPAARTG